MVLHKGNIEEHFTQLRCICPTATVNVAPGCGRGCGRGCGDRGRGGGGGDSHGGGDGSRAEIVSSIFLIISILKL